MPTLDVFDPAMCCASGVCGPQVDPVLPRFSADLEWLKGQGIIVNRYNLGQQPAAFADNATVKGALSEGDGDCLPLILIDGKVVSRKAYPARESLAAWLGLSTMVGDATVSMKECCSDSTSCS